MNSGAKKNDTLYVVDSSDGKNNTVYQVLLQKNKHDIIAKNLPYEIEMIVSLEDDIYFIAKEQKKTCIYMLSNEDDHIPQIKESESLAFIDKKEKKLIVLSKGNYYLRNYLFKDGEQYSKEQTR